MKENREKKAEWFQLGLMVLILILILTNAALFWRMNRNHGEILTILDDLKRDRAENASIGLAPGTAAPDFQLQTLAGEAVTRDAYSGARLLLVFTAPQCPACETAYPMLRRLEEKYADWQVLMVSQGPQHEIQTIVERENLSFLVAYWSDTVGQAFKVSGLPFAAAIDEHGHVIGSEYILNRDSLTRLLGEK